MHTNLPQQRSRLEPLTRAIQTAVARPMMKRLERAVKGKPPDEVTAEHVAWGYRLFLDREPENESVVLDKFQNFRTTRELRANFMLSYEFRLAHPGLVLMDDRNIVIKELDDGVRLFLVLSDYFVSVGILCGRYEQSGAAFVRSTVKPGQVVIDAGANVGFYTMLLGSLVGTAGTVHAFEPVPDIADLLERSIKENHFEDRVVLERIALGERSYSGHLVVPQHAPNSGTAHLTDNQQPLGAYKEAQPVVVKPLDECEIRRPVSFVKMDVEGAEPFIVRGGTALLATDRPVILSEINPGQLQTVAQCTPREFIREVESLGYDCHLLADGAPGKRVNDVRDKDVESVVFMPRR